MKNWLSRLTQKRTDDKPSSLYELIGGEKVAAKLCQRFYDIMEEEVNVAELRAIHPQDLTQTRQKFYEFMTGWLGGPPLFESKYGHPRLRARHLHARIDDQLVNQWLYCMKLALEQSVKDRKLRQVIWQNLLPLAHHMKNHSAISESQLRG
ncbi:group II truncated hemoglobin [Bowmanella dokdonensis]|uniref:Group II truncated hemoglobin n=2 Tax=Bowmanella dokdonensis TaxID=751969 RepID=A0A939DN89_9ALTE|nr:group II truncated hemoglobin [Bowmanella dokdonensis]